MAMELWVLSDKKLNSIAEWQSAIDAEGFALQLSDGTSFGELNGFLPAHLRGRSTGFECNHWPASAFMHEMQEMLGTDFGHDWTYVLAFRWRGDFNELRAAWIAGAAYAQATGGIVFDDQEGKLRSAVEAREVARVEYETPDPDVRSVADKVLQDLKLGPYRET
jgi:hypothetical protein